MRTLATLTISGLADCHRTSGETVAGSPYTITCDPGTLSSANYSFATGTTADFTINKKVLSVNAVDASKIYGAADPAFASTYSGFITGENVGTSRSAASPTATGRRARPSPAAPTRSPAIRAP